MPQRKVLVKPKRRSKKRYLIVGHLKKVVALVMMLAVLGALYGVYSLGWIDQTKTLLIHKLERAAVKIGFSIRHVTIDGRTRTPYNDVLKALQINDKQTAFSYDLDAALVRLKQLTWVHGARLERRLPDTLYIKLVEKYPIGFWQEKSKTYLVDQYGRLIAPFPVKDFPGYIIATGHDAYKHLPQLVRTLAPFHEINAKTTGAIYVAGRRWDLILLNQLRVKLAEDAIVASLEKLDQILKDSKIHLSEISAIDLRSREKIYFYIRPKNNTDKTFKKRSKIA